MLGTFDLGDVDCRTPDEILSTLDPVPTVSGPDDPAKAPRVDERAVTADTPAVEDVESDEILRELEEHHHRGPTSARPSAPRGSAELEPISRRKAPPQGRREVRGRASGESKPRGRRKRVVVALAAAAVFTATASAVTLSQLGGAAARPATPIRSSRLAATTAFTLWPTNLFDAVANTTANEERQLIRRVKSPVQHHPRGAIVTKRSARHYVVAHAAVTTAASTAVASSTPSELTGSQPASQPLESSGSGATTASHSAVSSGPVGPIGPGYVIGSNCNPKCR